MQHRAVSASGHIVSVPPKLDMMHSAPPGSINRLGSGVGGPSSSGVKDHAEIKALKAEKRALKIKLRKFEEDFIKKNGHKPQSYQVASFLIRPEGVTRLRELCPFARLCCIHDSSPVLNVAPP